MKLLHNALILYAVFMFYLASSKPAFFFKNDGSIREYGSSEHQTLVSVPMVCVGSAVGIYFWLFTHHH